MSEEDDQQKVNFRMRLRGVSPKPEERAQKKGPF